MIRPDVIIPVYKPDNKFEKVIEGLLKQTVRPSQIILAVTEENCDDTEKIKKRLEPVANKCDRCGNNAVRIRLIRIKKSEFDHGGTRNYAVRKCSDAPYFVCMTQDAIPVDEHLLEILCDSVEQEGVEAAYARQCADEGASFTERRLRTHNYPDTSSVKGAENKEECGIRTYMISNVCAIYRRKTYEKLGGFVTDTIFNEDMIFGSRIIENGGKIAYCAKAAVYHTHNYGLKTQFKRSFDLAVSQKDYPEVFQAVSSEKEGISYVREGLAECRKDGDVKNGFLFVTDAAVRYIGYLLGKNYKKLPKKMILSCTLQPAYWKKKEQKKRENTNSSATKENGRDGRELCGEWTAADCGMEEEAFSKLRELHSYELAALKAFVGFCEAYDLNYYAIGGTLLGAVRHEGFIPWDDDVDVAMPRKDYDRLIELAVSGEAGAYFGDAFSLECYQTSPEFKSYFAKIASTECELYEELLTDETKRRGYLIDILPIDGTPDDQLSRKVYYAKAMGYRFLCGTANVNTGIRTSRPKWEQTVLKVVRFLKLYRFLDVKKIYEKMDRLFKKQDSEGAKYCGTLTGAYKTKEIVPRKYFGEHYGEYSTHTFEDITLRGPKDYERYLTHMYGDYMELPPMKERKVHYRPFTGDKDDTTSE